MQNKIGLEKKTVKVSKLRPYVAYYRVSTKRQGKSGLGLEAQRTAVRNFLKNKYPPKYEFTEIESGGKDRKRRPKLDEALTICKEKNAILIVAKLDRLSRSLHLISKLQKHKVKFVICDMPFANSFSINIMACVAELERDTISKRIKDALAETKKKGKKLGYNNTKIKKGLKKHWLQQAKQKKLLEKETKPKLKKELVKKEPTLTKYQLFLNTSQQVKVITTLKEKGYSIAKITNYLNNSGLTSRQGQSWHLNSVQRIVVKLNL